MKIEKNKVVAVSYELRISENSEEIVDVAYDDDPLEFIFGSGMMLQKFEDNLEGLSKGDTFELKLSIDEGYGDRNEDFISEIPKEIFEQNGKIEDGLLDVGNIIPMQDENGNHFNGQVIESDNQMIKMDFNHPLAGEELYFSGKILNVRVATKQEMKHGHVHSHGHDH
jgi:FKBP-type peptidyl-prolyl cis-trans isomerase SlyD